MQEDVIGRRVASAAIDATIIFILLFAIAKLLGDEGARGYSLWAETAGAPRALFFVLTYAYFAGAELVWGQTIGKRVMNLRVVSASGAKPTTGAVLLRNVVRFVDWLPGFYVVGGITVFATGSRRQRLGDMAAKTRVVAVDATPPEPPPSPPDDEDVLAQVLR